MEAVRFNSTLLVFALRADFLVLGPVTELTLTGERSEANKVKETSEKSLKVKVNENNWRPRV